MATYRFIAFSVPEPGREDELDHWYDTQHIPDCLKLDGFVAAQRFRIPGEPVGTAVPKWKVMVIYEIESDDIDATMAQIAKVVRTPAMPITDAFPMDTALRVVGLASSPRFTQDDAKANAAA